MGKRTEIKAALAAIKAQPGAHEYAAVAASLLEQGNLEQALQICREGFAASPQHEQGAVVFLTALRKRGDISTAAEVFGRAIAFIPQSARVRVAWALHLVDAGKNREAYNLTREAFELDPQNEEAKVLLSNLAPTEGRNANQPPPVPIQKAEVRPWVRPIGQRTTPHSMFDLTPAPFLMNAKEREGLHRGEVSIFDIQAPAVDEEEKYVEDDISNLDVEVPPDLFDDPYFPPENATIDPLEFDLVEPTQVSEPPPMISDSMLSEPATSAAIRPIFTPPPPIPDDAMDSLPRISEIAFPMVAASSPRKADDTVAEVMPTVLPLDSRLPPPEADGSSLMMLLPKRRIFGPWVWYPVLILLVAAMGLGGFFGFNYWQARSLSAKTNQLIQQTFADRYHGYLAAQRGLDQLLREHPQHAQIAAGLVLVDAHLWSRFLADDRFLAQAQPLIRKGSLTKESAETFSLGSALLQLGQGKPQEAEENLGKISTNSHDWHFQVVAILAAKALGRKNRLQQIITEATGDPTRTSAGVLLEAAIALRWLGDYKAAERLIEHGLMASPGHPGLLIQRGIVQVFRSLVQKVDVNLTNLEATTKEIPRYRADLAFLKGLLATKSNDLQAAQRWVTEAHLLAPKNAEYAAQLGSMELGEGGDCAKAQALFQRALPERGPYDPSLSLQLIKATILRGRPQQAQKLLEQISSAQLDPALRVQLYVLAIDIAQLTGDKASIKKRCAPAAIKESLPLHIACAEAAIALPEIKLTQRMIQNIPDAGISSYLRGINALSSGDTAAAISLLKNAPQRIGYRATPLLALAKSYSQQGNAPASIPLLRKAVISEARSIPSRTALAMALVDAGHDAEATTLLEEILTDKPTQISVLTRVGETFLTMGQPQKASDLIDPVLKAASGSASLQLLAGQIAMANNRPKVAEKHFQAALRLAPHDPKVLVTLGQLENAQGKTASAQRRFAAALVIRPKDPEILILVAIAEVSTKDYHSALAHGMKAIRQWIDSGQKQQAIEAMVQLGKQLAKGDAWARSRAAELLFESTKANNPPVNAFLELGRLYRGNKDYSRAVWCFRQVTVRDPNLPEGHLELGLTLRIKPKWKAEAKTAFKQYLALSPKGKTAERVRKIIARMR